MNRSLINSSTVIGLLFIVTSILFFSSFNFSSIILLWFLFILLNYIIKYEKLLILFSFLIGIIFMICLYHYWIFLFGNSYFLGEMSDDWQYDIFWTEGYISKYGMSTSGLFDHLNEIKPGLGILHNSRGYVMLVIYLRYFASLLDGYHTLLPRILNIFFLTLTAYYSSIIAFSQSKSIKVRKLTFLVIFFYPVLLFNSSHIFRDILISFILIYTYYTLSIKKNSFSTILKILPLLIVLFFLRTSTFLVCLIMISLLYFNIKKINYKLVLTAAFFSIISILFLGSFFEHAISQINSYNVLNTQRFGTIGSAIFSLPIYFGFIPRMIYLFFTPVPNFSGIHQLFLSISAFMQVFSFPYLIFALKQKNIDLKLKLTFLLFFLGVAFSSADFRHVMMFLPFGIILAILSYYKTKDEGLGNKNYFLLLGLLFLLFFLSISIALILN